LPFLKRDNGFIANSVLRQIRLPTSRLRLPRVFPLF
jgi:hypothetical protein